MSTCETMEFQIFSSVNSRINQNTTKTSLHNYEVQMESKSGEELLCVLCHRTLDVVNGVIEGRLCSVCHVGRYHHFCPDEILKAKFDVGPRGEFPDGDEVESL